MIAVEIAGNSSPQLRLLLQVHDELLIEAKAAEWECAADEVRRLMEGAVKLNDVAFPVRIAVSNENWAAC